MQQRITHNSEVLGHDAGRFADRSCRHGLATLELVLALPILLFLMALMVNFGLVASWKARGSSVARFEAWRARHERSGYVYPRADSWWPAAASYGHSSAGNIIVANSHVGAVATDTLVPNGAINANSELLDVTRGLVRGSASLDRAHAMLASLGQYHLQTQTYLLDDKWQYHEMGLASNGDHRSTLVYNLPTASSRAYVKAATDLYYTFYCNEPWTNYIAPLDRDPEFLAYGRIIRRVDPRYGISTPDFHPQLQVFCGLDTSLVDELVHNLIDRIQGNKDLHVSSVAERMTRAFVDLYTRARQAYQTLMSADPPPSNLAEMQSQVDQLEQDIKTLNQFLDTFQQ